MLSVTCAELSAWIAARIRERSEAALPFFTREAPRLANACRAMAERFRDGGRLLAFGRGPYATDAMHVSVEFVHPVIIGKRALPALDVSIAYRDWLPVIARPCDMLIGFGPPEGDPDVLEALHAMRARGAMTLAMPGGEGDYAVPSPSRDPHVHQELIEALCHMLYETVHVFLEHRELGHELGASAFLYPFLGTSAQPLDAVESDVVDSILEKAHDGERLREQVAAEQAAVLAAAALAMCERLDAGGKLIFLGNGGSATDAVDWTLDCILPHGDAPPIPAIALSLEPACITAIANDVGTEVIFVRQLVAQAEPNDVVVALSTSGGSKNVVAALTEARRRGLTTVALLGYDGGEIARHGLADYAIVVHCDYVPRIQEAQGTMYHVLREAIARAA